MPVFRRGRSRSPSMPVMENRHSPPKDLLDVPKQHRGRSRSLDTTSALSLVAHKATSLFRRTPSVSPSLSPASSCTSTQSEMYKEEQYVKGRCVHCMLTSAHVRRQNSTASLYSSSSSVSSSGVDLSADETAECRGGFYLSPASISEDQSSVYSVGSNDPTGSEITENRRDFRGYSTSSGGSPSTAPEVIHHFEYPSISIDTECTSNTSMSGDEAHCRRKLQHQDCVLTHPDINLLSVDYPYNSTKAICFSSDEEEVSEAMSHTSLNEATTGGSTMTSLSANGSILDDHAQMRRRCSEGCHNLYTNALTLKVPHAEAPLLDDSKYFEVEQSDLTSVHHRTAIAAGSVRRASLDDIMMSMYRNFHNFPSNINELTRCRLATAEGDDPVKAIYNRNNPSSQSTEEASEVRRMLNNVDNCKVDWSRRKVIRDNCKSCHSRSTFQRPAVGRRVKCRRGKCWSERAVQGAHLWTETASGDSCYISDKECLKGGSRKRCSACHIIVHVACIDILQKMSLCKPTFREAGVRNYREEQTVMHHWIHKRKQEGKCKACGKSFPQKNFPFQTNKDIVGISCSWCKTAYHNRTSCFSMELLESECSFGEFSNIIIPPSWIIKIPKKLAFQSSMKKFNKRASKKKSADKKMIGRNKSDEKKKDHDYKPFIIKPIPCQDKKPLIVFVNPRSGGNQGIRLLQKFHFYLNPRQVFDLGETGPSKGLELYKKVPNLHILVCGGDGTVGWVLSEIDNQNFAAPPAVAVLPLGTGNDLARTLNWGSGYTDEPMTKVLAQVEESQVVLLDRWDVAASPLPVSPEENNSEAAEKEVSCTKLPISVMNNYFSLGADAHVLMEFHESREANPEKFNSRLWNKLFLAGAGSKDLLKRAWKDLTEHIVSFECDGVDMTSKIRDLKLHCLLFLNIPKYSSGTNPWGTMSSSTFDAPTHNDGKIEVIGFTTTQLAAMQVGGHGEKIAQCGVVKFITRKTIPMQVDGEPCRLQPSVITVSRRNQARMLIKQKQPQNHISSMRENVSNRVRLQVSRISLKDYETYHYDKDRLKDASVPLGIVLVDRNADLETIRGEINRLGKDMCHVVQENSEEKLDREQGSVSMQKLSPNWCFLDSTTAVRFFRVDQGQEHLHYITDISSEDLFILDPGMNSSASEATSPIGENPPNDHPRPTSYDSVAYTGDFKYPVTPPRSPLPIDKLPNLRKLRAEIPTISVEGSNRRGQANKALADAAKRGDVKKFVEAHENGADMLKSDGDGMSVLHNAARFNYKEIVKYIIASGPTELIDKLDKEKRQTALHKAAWYQRRTICCMLVAAGASLSATDKQGNTPKAQALRAEDLDLANYLEYQEMLQRDASLSTAV